MMGKHSNIILIDATDDRILESLKTPTLAKEVVARAAETELWDAYQQVITYFDPKHVSPQLFTDGNEPIAVSALPLQQFPNATSQAFDTMSDAFCAYYDAITLKEHIASEHRTLTQALKKQKGILRRKAKALQTDLERAEKSDDYRIQGELILANLHTITRGQTQVELQNYYSPELEKLTIHLNPEQTPSDNAQAYFKKYTKAKRGRSRIQQLISDLDADQETLQLYTSKLESADTLEALQRLRAELSRAAISRHNSVESRSRW
ncbi:Rqc2 homolog RqcH [Geodia barretti]|uniref:Rqc2 homolog RqcH n=1 Tax=Geodia barretti TaxID=519541 RepID=A0AA35RV43_GEOBA|nr:Rqc2 homolog RqcH [Geodia barretti]